MSGTIRAALAACDLVGVLRAIGCDQFMEAEIHGSVCAARIGTTVFVVPPRPPVETDGNVSAQLAPVMIATLKTEEVAIAHFQRHAVAMEIAAAFHAAVCDHGESEANPLMDLLGSTPPDTLPHDWQS